MVSRAWQYLYGVREKEPLERHGPLVIFTQFPCLISIICEATLTNDKQKPRHSSLATTNNADIRCDRGNILEYNALSRNLLSFSLESNIKVQEPKGKTVLVPVKKQFSLMHKWWRARNYLLSTETLAIKHGILFLTIAHFLKNFHGYNKTKQKKHPKVTIPSITLTILTHLLRLIESDATQYERNIASCRVLG